MNQNTAPVSQKIMMQWHHLGDRMDLKEIKNSLSYKCIYADPTELMYELGDLSYFRIYDYGSIVFLGVDHHIQTGIISTLRHILQLEPRELMTETFGVEINPDIPYDVLFDRIIVKELRLDIAQILMLNMAQSVALDYYIDQSNILMSQTTHLSLELEEQGRFSIKGKKLLKYIGRALNLKNKIAQNLYIFDSPNITWNDEFLNVLNNDLGRELDIKLRHKSLQENLSTVRENLEIFQDISQHYHSAFLEWIVIILIAVEIVNVFIDKIF